jgi:hypothetical protein
MSKHIVLSLLLAAISYGTVRAQDATDRRSFPFFDAHLTIEVHAAGAGTLEVLRGGRGRVEVTGRTEDGILAFGVPRTTGGPLRLSAAGGAAVRYVVVVPEGVLVNVQLPDQPNLMPGAAYPMDVYRWGATPSEAYGITPVMGAAALTEVLAEPTAPAEVALPNLTGIRRIGVRIEGSTFRIASAPAVQATSALAGNARRIDLQQGNETTELEVFLPAGTQDFILRVGGNELFVIRAGQPRTDCSPLTTQRLPDGRRWFDFAPQEGRLICGN